MIHREDIIHAARPLRWIFWGALLVLLDISFTLTSGGTGFQFDLLDDTIGMLLITVAVGRLRHIHVDPSHAKRMRFIHWVSILALLESITQHFVFERPWLLTSLSSALALATLLAPLVFCTCMRDLCRAATLSEAEGGWRRTYALFLFLYGIPGILLLLAGIVASVTGQPFQLDLGTGGALVLGAVFLVSLISFFRATSTMARSAEAMPDATPDVAPLPPAAALGGR